MALTVTAGLLEVPPSLSVPFWTPARTTGLPAASLPVWKTTVASIVWPIIVRSTVGSTRRYGPAVRRGWC